jgi:predicted 3-demethylubiquinone-9 3-methyltransferase (glyoxalase superfamily)
MKMFTPCLCFDGRAEEAARFYTSIFSNSRITGITRHGAEVAQAAGRPEGSVLTVEFQLDGQPFLALNGGPDFTFTPAISFIANCDTQAEIDQLWEKLAEGGQTLQCGWLTDKFGVSWQVVPSMLGEMMRDKDSRKIDSMMGALLQMTKLDIAALQQAYEQPPHEGAPASEREGEGEEGGDDRGRFRQPRPSTRRPSEGRSRGRRG